jgi:alkylhydroperoxidase family enzyme
VSAKIERLAMAALAPALQQALAGRVKRLGYLGEFFRCSGHQPDVLLPFMAMTDALKAALPERLTEIGALTVSVVMGNAYERNQHERLCEKLGLGRDWIAAVIAVTPDRDSPLSPAERAVQRLVIAVIERRGHGVETELDAVVDAIGDAPAMAMLFLIGRYVTQAFVVNALALAPPVPSIFGEAS